MSKKTKSLKSNASDEDDNPLLRQLFRKLEKTGAHFTVEALNDERLIQQTFGHAEVRKGLEDVYKTQDLLGLELIDARSGLTVYSKDPISIFLLSMELGLYPPPEVMFCLENAFKAYLNKGSELGFEHAFFGKLGKGKNSYSIRKNKAEKYQFFDDFLGQLQIAGEVGIDKGYDELHSRRYKFSQEIDPVVKGATLERAVNNKESFLRGYRRWKSKIKTETP